MIAGLVLERLKDELKQFSDLVIWDVQNLLYLVKDDEVLRNGLIAILSFSTDELDKLNQIKYGDIIHQHKLIKSP